ncbi:MAG: hypothetical protein ACKPBU_00985 [Alphaproteobacteria bacterium]
MADGTTRRRVWTRRVLAATAALLVSGCATPIVRAEPVASPTPAWSRVIVTLRVDPATPDGIPAVRDRLLAGLPADGHRVLRVYSVVPAVALEVSPAVLESLRSSPLVANVKADSLEAPSDR